MDPEYEGSDDEAAAMAAMMGFASFGGKPPAKKRKFNAATDAFVEGQSLEKIDRGGKKGQGSGGNNIKLGKQRVFGHATGKKEVEPEENEDEIELDDGDEDGNVGVRLQDVGMKNARLAEGNEDTGPQYLDTSLPAPAEAQAEGHEREDGPAYIDTSTAPPILSDSISAAEAAEVQSRIDALLNSIGSGPPPPSNDPSAGPEYKAPGLSTLPSPSRHLPNRPAFVGGGGGSDTASVMSSPGRGGGSSWGGRSRGGPGGRGRGGGGGERNEKWYEGYYDPTFNYNPWEKLEKERGLQGVGTWLEHQQQPRR